MVSYLLKTVVPTLFLTACIITPLQADEINLQPGMWQWTTMMEIPGMAMQVPPVVHSGCINREDLVPTNQNQHGDCTITDQTISNSQVTWTVNCSSPQGSSTMNGVMNYSGDTAQGTMNVIAQGMTMNSTISGERTGGCAN